MFFGRACEQDYNNVEDRGSDNTRMVRHLENEKRYGPNRGLEKHRKDTPLKKEKLVQIIIQEGSGKREVTMRKSSLRESRNYDANISYATSANSNG